mmetsp:Transcript_8932/g.28224  ORF Transcript_8932/g.28224 Transcript_8932/m.28224 type:complete len:213 (+) Transcript_8932:399-1037(+)
MYARSDARALPLALDAQLCRHACSQFVFPSTSVGHVHGRRDADGRRNGDGRHAADGDGRRHGDGRHARRRNGPDGRRADGRWHGNGRHARRRHGHDARRNATDGRRHADGRGYVALTGRYAANAGLRRLRREPADARHAADARHGRDAPADGRHAPAGDVRPDGRRRAGRRHGRRHGGRHAAARHGRIPAPAVVRRANASPGFPFRGAFHAA